MAAFENTVTITRPVEEVFTYLADAENLPQWNYAIEQARKISPRALKTCASVLVIWQINATGGIRPEKPVINFATLKKFLAQLAARDARSKFASAVRDHV